MKKIVDRTSEQDKYFKKWLIDLSPRTKENYPNEFPDWLPFIGMTPTEQVKMRMHDLTNQGLTQRTFFEQKFREYKEHQRFIVVPKWQGGHISASLCWVMPK